MNSARISYWERIKLLQGYDFVIIGGGIVGVNAAITVATHSPKASVLILERGVLPHGASTKNAGFACFGSVTELLDDLAVMTEDQVIDLVRQRWQGLSLLKERVPAPQMAYSPCGGFEVFVDSAQEARALEGMSEVNRILADVFDDGQTFAPAAQSAAGFGFAARPSVIANGREGSLDPMMMMDSLSRTARQMGVEWMSGAEVAEIGVGSVRLVSGLEISARRIIVATNGFARQLLPEADMAPARAQVLITEPIVGLALEGVFHLDRGYYYFRNVSDRILFGGGRHLDYEGETTRDIDCSDLIMNDLERILRAVIVPGLEVVVDHRWAGIMGIGPKRAPIVKEISTGVFCAVRLGGMGVALGSKVGDAVARLALDS